MQKFELTIFRQSRILIAVFLTPFSFIGFLMLGSEMNSPAIGLILFAFYLLIAYYFVVGHLTITIKNDQLKFMWARKMLFNYDEVEPVNISDIKALVIDDGQLLRKIVTYDQSIYINNSKVKIKEAAKFIQQLRIMTKNTSAREMDSWDEWADKGYLKTAYRINTIILVLAAILVAIAIIMKGFNSTQLLLFLLFIPQLFLYGQQMKRKIKKEKNSQIE